MYKDGMGTKKDSLKAVGFYQKACGLDNGSGCFDLGVMYKDGTGIKHSSLKAVKFYQKACNLDNGNGCYNLGRA
jgi:TPR repeat protein